MAKKRHIPWNKGIEAPSISRGKMGKKRPDMIGHKRGAGKKYHLGYKHSEWTKKMIGKANTKGEISKSNGYKQIWNGEKYILISHINWCKANQIHRVPDGCVIHHIDMNHLSNESNNLQLMTKDFHTRLHQEFNKQNGGNIVVTI